MPTLPMILLWNLAILIPIALGWLDPFAVLLCYWLENVGTGVFQYLRMRDCERARPDPERLFADSRFFAAHYGLFTLVHGILVIVFFGIILSGMRHINGLTLVSMLAILAGQWLSYRFDWQQRQGWRGTSTERLMLEPYVRVVVLHLVVLLGGWLALSAAQPVLVLLMFATLKLVIEVLAAYGWRRLALKPPTTA